jgi:glycosyltransferase involved in cell wall biosynthesis
VSAIKVLHLIDTMTIGGAQRSVATLCRTGGHDARVARATDVAPADVGWADVIVAHVWRHRRGDPHVPVPSVPDPTRLAVFNHDVEGHIDAACAVVVVYSAAAARRQVVDAPVEVVPGGIGLDGLRKVARARTWRSVDSLGRLSTLHDGKIAPRTIQWWPDVPVPHVVVGGAGSQDDVLRRAFLGTRIEFVGEIPPRHRTNFLAHVDIFCYQTEWHEESFGYVVLEALAAGCVVVTEPRGALPERIVDDVTGVLVDGHGAAEAAVRALAVDPERCARLSAAAMLSASAYTKRAMQERFGEVIAALMSGRRTT